MHPRETCDFAQRCASPVVFTNALSFPGPPIRVRRAEHEQPVQGSRRHASHPHELGRVHCGRSTLNRKSDLAVLKILTELFRPLREQRGVVRSERESVCVYYASITGGLRSPLAVISNQGNFGGHACKAPCAEHAHGKRSSLTILSSRIFDITTKTLRKPSPLSHSSATISKRRRTDRAVVHMTHHTQCKHHRDRRVNHPRAPHLHGGLDSADTQISRGNTANNVVSREIGHSEGQPKAAHLAL